MTSEANKPTPSIERIAICGAGLAGHITAAALSRHLPRSIQITLVDCQDNADTDLFYGSVTGPSAYDFHLSAGLREPSLVLESDTAFSFGTRYVRWGGNDRSWMQCFHQPLPILDQVLFHHYLTQQNLDQLEPFLVSAVAARKGAFAHPPEQNAHPLSPAEYGYQFDPASYAELFAGATDKARVDVVASTISVVECGPNRIEAIRCADGRLLTADLYVDCTGPKALLLSRLASDFSGNRRLRAAVSRIPADQLGAPCRSLMAADFGWQADTPLKGSIMRHTIFVPEAEASALLAHGMAPAQTGEVTLGCYAQAWCGNCVGIGQAAAVFEPLTPAPIMLLQRDIERLLSLIPFSDEMSVERREYNRQYAEDCTHTELFNRALFETPGLPDTPYWRVARDEPIHEKLARKIELFENRGVHVAFDLEPFNQEDWTILHYGMGRRPARYDRVADQMPEGKIRNYLSNMRGAIENMVEAMPSHDAYMKNLTSYLMQQKG
ncbi:MAG: tryptophan 7-halogenase [Alphaproteobacteria bacterium]|nr:tryptophan 7-halogenase [Alphaproteobacteria bacterium]MDE2110115.1 tryptophan 7-halogenase [Alphaproteobacteria bacterium]